MLRRTLQAAGYLMPKLCLHMPSVRLCRLLGTATPSIDQGTERQTLQTAG